MECREAQERILEMFDGTSSPELEAHLASCPECAAFLARQAALDRELSVMLEPPELSPGFRQVLRGRIRQETPKLWSQALPDLVHVGACLAATGICAVALPFGAAPVLAAGVLVTAATYLPILAARLWLEA